ncbi:hypothetical protein G7Y89_g7516 [Cudoniella acicularis]|uniref:Uncharacterized protein n=1 Tax=Cudoniella acicularis TaxID=354080 RepID=A0A8H4RJ58_9HELO|nr:hypothetical protein G7Y89_g7516 [Cudoniella acicularis]
MNGSEIPPWTAENLDRKDLFLMWKSITHALISAGHVSELHQELDHASWTGREDLSSDENNRLACGYDDEEDGDTVMSSPGESEFDDNNVCDIPSNLIAEAAALPHYYSPLQSFEDIFAQEESLPSFDGIDDVTLSIETSSPRVFTPTSSPLLSNSEQEQCLNEEPGLYITAKQHIWFARAMKNGRLRLSDKKDLTPSEISVVAQRLIKNDSVIYFLNNCRLIYESLLPSLVQQQPLVCKNNSIKESVIATFDTVQDLVNGKDIHRLLLRFVYIHLVRVIDIYRAAAANDRVEGQVNLGVGKRDITVAVNMYLAAKKVSKGRISRTRLLDYYRRGKRWSFLAGPPPISVFAFSRAADTIVYILPLLHITRRDPPPQKAEQFHHELDGPGACSSDPTRSPRAC